MKCGQLVVSIVLAAFFMLSAGCSPESVTAATPGLERTALIAGFADTNNPPYVYRDYSGGWAGSDIDLMKAVCARIGLELVLQPIDWCSKNELLESGEIDCLIGGFDGTGLEDDFLWTDPYDGSCGIAFKKDAADLKDTVQAALYELSTST